MKSPKAVAAFPDVLTMHAQDLSKGEVVTLHFDPVAAKQGCLDGLTFLEPLVGELAKHSPGFDLDALRSLPELCERVVDIQRRLNKLKFERGGNAKDLIAAALDWRRKLMPIAESLAINGKVKSSEFERIVAGSGAFDNVTDVLDLVELLTPHASLVKGLCGPSALTLATDSARAALSLVRIETSETPESRSTADLRDRYATLIERRHDRLRVAIAVLTSYREAESIVGSLFTNTKSRAKAPVAPAPVDPEPVS